MSLENLIARCDHHLSSIGWGRYHTILFWICGFGWAADNMWLLLSAIFISELPTAWDLSETEAGLTAIIMMLGFLIGAYVWGYTSDVYGRMYSFRKTLLIAAFAAFGAAASVNLTMLLAFCLVAGFGIGGDVPVDGSVFIEFCPESERWRMTALGAI
jgi:MFS family permease